MPPIFTINFRREVYQRERARSRARVISLGIWLSYFGALVVVFGLYGLNCATVAQRTQVVERRAATLRQAGTEQVDWARQPAEMALLERGVADGRRWRVRLERLAVALPPGARLTAIQFNPAGVSGGPDWNRLLLTGVLSVSSGRDRMQGVAELVTALQGDSALARHFGSIRLASTRIAEASGNTADFVIECRP